MQHVLSTAIKMDTKAIHVCKGTKVLMLARKKPQLFWFDWRVEDKLKTKNGKTTR